MPRCFRLAHGGGGGGGGGGYRGPPPPLILAPIIYQLVRRSCDPKMIAYVKHLLVKQAQGGSGGGGAQALAANAHKIVQYALSKVPANLLYWFTARVLNLPAELALQTTEFLKSRTEIEMEMEMKMECADPPMQMTTSSPSLPLPLTWGNDASGMDNNNRSLMMGARSSPSTLDIERRLERLEMDYQVLQERHHESIKMLTCKPENVPLPRELPMPDSKELRIEASSWTDDEPSSTQLVRFESPSSASSESDASEVDGQALLQDVGLRMGRVFLEWAGETLKQSLVTAAAAKMSADQPFAGAGIDLAGRLVDAIIV